MLLGSIRHRRGRGGRGVLGLSESRSTTGAELGKGDADGRISCLVMVSVVPDFGSSFMTGYFLISVLCM